MCNLQSRNLKSILIPLTILLFSIFLLGCNDKRKHPYQEIDSIKYDTITIDYDKLNILTRQKDRLYSKLPIANIIDSLVTVSKFKGVHQLIDATLRNPFDCIGKPEFLKGNLAGCMFGKIDEEYRLVYKIYEIEYMC